MPNIEQIPNFIHCSITGIRFAVRPDVMLERIKKAGGLDRLKKTYVSRDARRLLKEGKTIEQIRAELGYDEEHANNNITLEVANTSSSMANVRRAAAQVDESSYFWRESGYKIGIQLAAINYAEATKDACFYPSIILESECNRCPIFEHCTFDRKRLPKVIKR